MTDEEMKDFLEANSTQIKQAVTARLIEGLISSHKWEMSEVIATEVNAFMVAEIVPEIKKFLSSEKGVILAAAQESARQIGDLLTQEMVKRAAKNLEGYSFRELIKGLFG